jgi:hypothetical protein
MGHMTVVASFGRWRPTSSPEDGLTFSTTYFVYVFPLFLIYFFL